MGLHVKVVYIVPRELRWRTYFRSAFVCVAPVGFSSSLSETRIVSACARLTDPLLGRGRFGGGCSLSLLDSLELDDVPSPSIC